jgi:hypothetical protein
MPCSTGRPASCVRTSTSGRAGPVALSETSLIERYFRGAGAQRPDVALGIGDDAAILTPPAD